MSALSTATGAASKAAARRPCVGSVLVSVNGVRTQGLSFANVVSCYTCFLFIYLYSSLLNPLQVFIVYSIAFWAVRSLISRGWLISPMSPPVSSMSCMCFACYWVQSALPSRGSPFFFENPLYYSNDTVSIRVGTIILVKRHTARR